MLTRRTTWWASALAAALTLTLLATGCDGGGGEVDEDCPCGGGEICVVHFDLATDETRQACVVAPSPCDGEPGDCSDTDCQRAGYALCDADYLGVACSDTFAPTIFSCNR